MLDVVSLETRANLFGVLLADHVGPWTIVFHESSVLSVLVDELGNPVAELIVTDTKRMTIKFFIEYRSSKDGHTRTTCIIGRWSEDGGWVITNNGSSVSDKEFTVPDGDALQSTYHTKLRYLEIRTPEFVVTYDPQESSN